METAVLFRHEIVATRWGFYDHDRWAGTVVACQLLVDPATYVAGLADLMKPKAPANARSKETTAEGTASSGKSSSHGDRLPTVDELLGPPPLSRDQAIEKLGDYIRCAPRARPRGQRDGGR